MAVLILLTLSASAAHPVQTSFSAEIESRIRYHRLNNGLRIIMLPNPASPTIACYLKIGVGSANEPFDIAGTAHFLEHLLFKGTDVIGTTDYAAEKPLLDQQFTDGERMDDLNRRLADPLLSAQEREILSKDRDKYRRRLQIWNDQSARYILSEEDSRIYSLAGEVGYNAYTTADVTNYQIKLPKNRLELWARLESERFINPVFREYYPERNVILEERRMRYDSNPRSLAYELLLKTMFGYSPYGKPVIGFAGNILHLRASDTIRFFHDNYTPSRMVVTLAGDFDPDEALTILTKYFSRIPDRDATGFPPVPAERQPGMKSADLVADHSPVLMMGWYRPAISHPDALSLDVAARLLTDGQNSRLVRRLVIEEKLVSSVSAFTGSPGEKLENALIIYAAPFNHSSYDQVSDIIRSEIKKLSESPADERELQRVKNRMRAELISSLAANAGMADNLSYYEVMTGDYRNFFRMTDRVSELPPEAIRMAVARYLNQKNETTVRIRKP